MKFLKAKQRALDYQRVFATEEGKRVLADLVHQAHFLNGDFVKDTNESYFQLGRRSIVTSILGSLDMKPADMERVMEAQRKYMEAMND